MALRICAIWKQICNLSRGVTAHPKILDGSRGSCNLKRSSKGECFLICLSWEQELHNFESAYVHSHDFNWKSYKDH